MQKEKSDTISPQQERWEATFGNQNPSWFTIGMLPTRFLRVYSMPEAKRWPETLEEMTGIVTRQLEVANALLGKGAICDIYGFDWDSQEAPSLLRLPDPFMIAGLDLTFAWSILEVEADPEIEDDKPSFVHVYAGTAIWDANFEPAARAIACDQAKILWWSHETGIIFSPYDGGMDIFANDQAERDALAKRFEHYGIVTL